MENKSKNISEKPVSGKKTVLRLAAYLSNNKASLAVIFVLVLVSIGTGLISSYMIRPIINNYIIPGDIPGLLRMIFILLAIYLAGVIATYIQYVLLNRIGQKTANHIRQDLFQKMEHLPLKYFDTHQHGDLMSRYTNDMDKISEMLTDNLSDIISAALTFLGIIVLMIYISPILTLVTFIIVPLMLLSARLIVKRSKKYFQAQQKDLGDTNGYIEEMISGQKVIKVFGHEKQAEEGFEKLNDSLRDKSEKAQLYSGAMMPVMQNLNTLNFVMVTIVGALLAIFRGFDVGGLAVFLQYSRQFGRPINELATLYNNLQAAMAGAERIFAIMDETPELPDSADAVDVKVEGKIELKDVWFGYDPDKMVLKGISLRVKTGEKVAFVGTTGAGKTTILNMIPRFYDYQKGAITIDDIEITKIKRKCLRNSLAIVLQDTHLFTGTVADNIRFGNLKATDEDVINAAKLTSAHSFIERLPQGYNTVLENDGSNLSQGQRQLLNIARAAVSNPAILLLDEATSNIDTRSERLIQEGLDELMKGRTSFVIAHRLSTVRNMDKIVVVDNGLLVESGTHDELMQLKGYYFRLHENRFDDSIDFLQ